MFSPFRAHPCPIPSCHNTSCNQSGEKIFPPSNRPVISITRDDYLAFSVQSCGNGLLGSMVILHFMENDIETLHDVVMYKGVLLSECNDD